MKPNKIIVAVHPDASTREKILTRLIIDCKFADIPSVAKKLIQPTISDIDLNNAYFVIADNYVFRRSPITQQRLYEMAARGIAVILGTNKLPQEYEFICEAYYQ